jgi:hypothetical protein
LADSIGLGPFSWEDKGVIALAPLFWKERGWGEFFDWSYLLLFLSLFFTINKISHYGGSDGDQESRKKSEKAAEAGFKKESETLGQKESQARWQKNRTPRLPGLRFGADGEPGLLLRNPARVHLLRTGDEEEVIGEK